MSKRTKGVILLLWVGAPFILLLALALINPSYTSLIFRPMGPLSGMTCLVGLQTLNLVALLVYFSRAKGKNEGAKGYGQVLGGLLLAATLLMLTFPSLWLVLFYPSIMILLQTNNSF